MEFAAQRRSPTNLSGTDLNSYAARRVERRRREINGESQGRLSSISTGAPNTLKQTQSHTFFRVLLWVLNSNKNENRFYEHHGLVQDGIEKEESIWGAVVDEIRMSKGFKP